MSVLYNFFNKNVKPFLENLLYFTIRFDTILVYLFSQTPLLFVYMFFVMFGFCAGNFASFWSNSCILIVLYVIGTSMSLCVVCNAPYTKKWVGQIVGVGFLNKYAPKNGVLNFLILFIALWLLLGLELISMQSFVDSRLEEYDLYTELQRSLIENNQLKEAVAIQEIKNEIGIFLDNPAGLLKDMHNSKAIQFLHAIGSRERVA